LSIDGTFFESKPEIFASPSSCTSEDDYDYMFYRETLFNSGGLTFETVASKDSL